MLADIKMPEMDGLELLKQLRQEYPWLTVVLMTAYGCIELAVEAIKAGAYDFITKPFDHDSLVLTLRKALERSRLLRENLRLPRCVQDESAFQNLVGKSRAMQWVYEAIQMVAKTDLTVLITGESGTGKDLTARAVHALSSRARQPFVVVNCPAVPEQILESELFGYRKGAFTHATQSRAGLFQEAHGGTIFLDEIGDISTSIQTKRLRVLQEKEIKPLGDTRSLRVDVRCWRRPTGSSKKRSETVDFEKTFTTASTSCPLCYRPSASAAKTSLSWWIISSQNGARNWANPIRPFPRN